MWVKKAKKKKKSACEKSALDEYLLPSQEHKSIIMAQSTRSTSRSHRGATSSAPPSSDIHYGHSKRLSLPHEKSSPKTWTRFCNDALMLLVSHYSLASALGQNVDSSVSSASDLASSLFSSAERDQYTAWKKGKSPPKVDWRRFSTALSSSSSAHRAKWTDLTYALRALYSNDSISRENCKAWVEKYTTLMPLVNAVRKVELVRTDTKAARVSSKIRKDVHEMVACRKIMAEIGRERVRANTALKSVHKEGTDRELELNRRLSRLSLEIPKDRDAVTHGFSSRENFYDKLVKVRLERIQIGTEVAVLNAEIKSLESALMNRIATLERQFNRLVS